MNNRIEIDLGFATLAVDKSIDPYSPREIYVSLEKNGLLLQDLVIITQKERYEEGELVYEEGIRVLVYADENNEDYTNEFNIGIYKEDS